MIMSSYYILPACRLKSDMSKSCNEGIALDLDFGMHLLLSNIHDSKLYSTTLLVMLFNCYLEVP